MGGLYSKPLENDNRKQSLFSSRAYFNSVMVKIPNRIKIMFSILCGSSCEGWSLRGEEKSGLGEASGLLLLFFLLIHRTDFNPLSFSYRKKAGLLTVSALDLDDCKS